MATNDRLLIGNSEIAVCAYARTNLAETARNDWRGIRRQEVISSNIEVVVICDLSLLTLVLSWPKLTVFSQQSICTKIASLYGRQISCMKSLSQSASFITTYSLSAINALAIG